MNGFYDVRAVAEIKINCCSIKLIFAVVGYEFAPPELLQSCIYGNSDKPCPCVFIAFKLGLSAVELINCFFGSVLRIML